MIARCRRALAMAVLLLAMPCGGAVAAEAEPPRAATSLAGLTLTYRFEVGRVYRAAYAKHTVHFELIEPRQADPPSAALPYRETLLREGLFLVVWDDPAYHTTFVIDLERRRLHASSLREREGSFLDVAEIVSVSSDAPALPPTEEQ